MIRVAQGDPGVEIPARGEQIVTEIRSAIQANYQAQVRNLKLAAGIVLLWAIGFAFAMTSDRVVGAVLEAVR